MRIFGAVLILASCAVSGAAVSGFFTRRAVTLEAFLGLITHVKNQINGFLYPLDSIFENYSEPTLERIGFLASLRKNGGEAAFGEYRGRLCLAENEERELEGFFRELGSHTAQDEARHCAYFEARIGELAKNARDELAKKKRMSLSLGALLGILIAVILI